jgi:uncharacterized protein YoxC
VEELDLSPYYVSIIAIGVASVALLVAVFPHLRYRKGARPTITNGDLLNEVTKHFQDLESKLQTGGATESVLDEVKAMRQDLESKYERRDATNSVLDEVKKLRTEFQSRFGAKFSNKVFGPDEAFAFFYAVSNSLERFEEDMSSVRDEDIDIIREAEGYVAIVQLVLSWAQANGQDSIKAKAEEFLNAAKNTLEKAKAAV